MLDKALVSSADVLAPQSAQEKDVEGGDLERPEREVLLVTLPHMLHVLAHGGSTIGRTSKIDAAGGTGNRLMGGTGWGQWQGLRETGPGKQQWIGEERQRGTPGSRFYSFMKDVPQNVPFFRKMYSRPQKYL